MDFDESHNQTQSQFSTQQRPSLLNLEHVLRLVAIVLLALVIAGAFLVAYSAKNGSLDQSVTTASEREIVAARLEVSSAKAAASQNKTNKRLEANLIASRARLIIAQAVAGEDVSNDADALLAENPQNPLVLFAAAKAYQASEDRSAESSGMLEQAAKAVTPQAGDLARMIYVEYAGVLEKRDDFSGSLNTLKQAASVSPVSVDVLYRMALLAKKQSNYYEQASAYCRIINVAPNDSKASVLLADLAKAQPTAVARAQADYPKREMGQ